MKAKLDELVMSLETESGYLMSYFDLKTGKIISISEEVFSALESDDEDFIAEFEEHQPAEFEAAKAVFDDPENTRFIPAPEQFDFNEYRHMEKFIASLPDESAAARLQSAIRGSGAFRRFKDTLHELGLQNKWYDWRDAALKEFVIDWCRGNNLEYEDDLPKIQRD